MSKQGEQRTLEFIIAVGGTGVSVLKLGLAYSGLPPNAKGGGTWSSSPACLGVEQKEKEGGA